MATLEELEGDVWPEPTFDSYLVTTCHRLRKKPIDKCSVEDLRIMIGQDMGLVYLLPMALERLEADPLSEGDMYPGDLVLAVTHVKERFYRDQADLAQRAKAAAQAAIGSLGEEDRDLIDQLEAFVRKWSR